MVLEALVPPQQEACKAAPGTDEQEADQPTECRLTSWLRPPTNATVAHVQGVLCADEYTACSGAGGCSFTFRAPRVPASQASNTLMRRDRKSVSV